MASPTDALPPEVLALVETTRRLTGQAFRLSRSINETVEELTEFTEDLRRGHPEHFHERRKNSETYEGEDRRA